MSVVHAMMDPVTTLLVGRDAELETLASTLGIATSGGDRTAVLLAGDAGVGKTRLLTELRDLAVDHGHQVMAGHCLDFADSALPYLPFSEIVGRLLSEQPDVVDDVAERHPALLRLQPGRRMLDRAGDHDIAAPQRADLFDAVHALAEAAAAVRPLLLVVEDLHWVDAETQAVLDARVEAGCRR